MSDDWIFCNLEDTSLVYFMPVPIINKRKKKPSWVKTSFETDAAFSATKNNTWAIREMDRMKLVGKAIDVKYLYNDLCIVNPENRSFNHTVFYIFHYLHSLNQLHILESKIKNILKSSDQVQILKVVKSMCESYGHSYEDVIRKVHLVYTYGVYYFLKKVDQKLK